MRKNITTSKKSFHKIANTIHLPKVQGICQGGFAVIHMCDDTHGADIIRLVHDLSHLVHCKVRHGASRNSRVTATKTVGDQSTKIHDWNSLKSCNGQTENLDTDYIIQLDTIQSTIQL